MTRKIKTLAACFGFIAAGVTLLNLAIKAGCYLLLFYYSL